MDHDIFNEAFTEISVVNGVHWNEQSRITLFGRFLESNARHLFSEWEKFLQAQAEEENGSE